jgi:hypothetical protein
MLAYFLATQRSESSSFLLDREIDFLDGDCTDNRRIGLLFLVDDIKCLIQRAIKASQAGRAWCIVREVGRPQAWAYFIKDEFILAGL